MDVRSFSGRSPVLAAEDIHATTLAIAAPLLDRLDLPGLNAIACTAIEISGVFLEDTAASLVICRGLGETAAAFLPMRSAFPQHSRVWSVTERRSSASSRMSQETFRAFLVTLRRSSNHLQMVVNDRPEVIHDRRKVSRDVGAVIDKPPVRFS